MTFLDTGFLFALLSELDAHHGRVVEVFNTFKGLRLADHLLTSNHVLAETITLTLKIGHGKAVALGEQLYAESSRVSIGQRPTKNGLHLRTSRGTKTKPTASSTV